MRQHLQWGVCALVVGVIGLSVGASGATFSLSPATTTVDDTWVVYSDGDTNHGTQAGNMCAGAMNYGLLGYKDLFTLVPPTSGSDAIVIDSATLTMTVASTGGHKVWRVTSDWLTRAAGSNQTNATDLHRDLAGGLVWAGDGSFDTDDFDTTLTVDVPSGGYNTQQTADVTGLVAAMYAAGQNYGFVMTTTDGYVRTQENNPAGTQRLDITYHYAAVPEPATLGLLALGGLSLIARRQRLA